MNIDLVYLWVDGSDPIWVERRNACIGKPTSTLENCKGRYADNDELKYSLRSVDKYAPWIRKIFIVTYEQVPKWLDTSNPQIQIVDHKEILPPECIPCFNSRVIEHHLHLIPGLSEHFLFANDDMFFNKPVTPEKFFAKDNLPIIRMNFRILKKYIALYKQKFTGKKLNSYARAVHNGAMLVENKFGKYYSSKTHHNIDAYLKSSYNLARQLFKEEIDATLRNHMRSDDDIQRNFYSYVALATNCAHLKYVSQRTSFRFHIDNRKHYKKLLRFNPMLFCMNDSQFSNDDDRKCANAFLGKYFPDKSQFEK